MKSEFEQELLVPDTRYPKTNTPKKVKQKKSPRKNNGSDSLSVSLVLLAAIVVCILVGTFMIRRVIGKCFAGLTDGFHNTVDTAASETYDFFYKKSYESAYAQNHVRNKVSIIIGPLREKAELEVLEVHDVEYTFGALSDKKEKWLKSTGSAVFTVNLAAGEFLTDDARQYVLMRVPAPEVGAFNISDPVDISPEQKKGLLSSFTGFGGDHADEESDLANTLVAEAQVKMQETVSSSPYFYNAAKDAAKTTLINFVKSLNPEIPELTVEVEFFE